MGKPTIDEVLTQIADKYMYGGEQNDDGHGIVEGVYKSDVGDIAKFVSVRGYTVIVDDMHEHDDGEDTADLRIFE